MKDHKDLVALLKQVQSTGGLDVSCEAICEYQDMIGHSCEEDLAELANGPYKEAFYKVYGYAYGTVEAIRFHCKHGEKIRELFDAIADWEEKHARISEANKLLNEQLDNRQDMAEKFREAWEKEKTEKEKAQARIAELEKENQALKAKLYDMMTA